MGVLDHLILLTEGHIVYNAPMKSAYEYFKNGGFKCPEHFNQTDYYMDCISLDYRNEECLTKS